MYKAIEAIPGQSRYTSFDAPPIQTSETYVLNEDYDWENWQAKYKLLLEEVIPGANSQRTSFIEVSSIYGNLKKDLKAHLSNLKAVKETYEKGLFRSSQSALGSFSLEDVSKLLKGVPTKKGCSVLLNLL